MRLASTDAVRQHYGHLYVSPHMDDAVLSCGGRIAMQVSRGEKVLVVTVFSGIDEKRAASTGALLPMGGIDQLKREDDAALERLGVDHLRLDYCDGAFRQRFPLMRYGLHLREARQSADLLNAIRTDLERIRSSASCSHLYVPLGIGQHIDHHLAFLIGDDLRKNPENTATVTFYEDIPYVFIPRALSCRLKAIGVSDIQNEGKEAFIGKKIMDVYRAVRRLPTLTRNRRLRKGVLFMALSAGIIGLETVGRLRRWNMNRRLQTEMIDASDGLETKVAAIMAYQSQAQLFFHGEDELRRSLMRYSMDIGGRAGQYLERCWQIVKGE